MPLLKGAESTIRRDILLLTKMATVRMERYEHITEFGDTVWNEQNG